jgi:hypothetical protein
MEPKERKTVSIDGVFDIETETWDKFVVGDVYDIESCKHYQRWWQDEQELVDYIISLPSLIDADSYTLWAHNGGRFDTLWVAKRFLERYITCDVFSAGARIVCLKVRAKHGDLIIRDSAALIPMSLRKAAAIGGTHKLETGLLCVCTEEERLNPITGEPDAGCGGYCSITRNMSPSDMLSLSTYLGIDCVALAKTLRTLHAFAEEKDLDLAGTIGSSSWKSAQRRLALEDADWRNNRTSPGTLYNYVKGGYFGGRTQTPCPVPGKMVFRYDMNSAYPAALANIELPTGRRYEKYGKEAQKAYDSSRDGVFSARVFVPESFLPPLPRRTKERITYPVGEFWGEWTGNELRYAQTQGVEVRNISRCCVWDSSTPVFRDYCRYLWSLRADAGPKTALGQWCKWLANSLTGKLAQRPETEVVVINPREVVFCPADANCKGGVLCKSNGWSLCCPHKCRGACGSYKAIDPDKQIWTREMWRLDGCSYVHWAAYLTAHTRVQLHKFAIADGMNGLGTVYMDTDSVYTTVERHGEMIDEMALGKFKLEGMAMEFASLAPKTYSYIDPETGEFVHKSKGIPEGARNFELLLQGKRVPMDRGVRTFKTAARGGNLFQRKQTSRQLHADGIHFGDRILGPDGRTYPQTAVRDNA